MNDNKQLITITKSELAANYRISPKQLLRRCKRAGVIMSVERILLPKKVREIVRALGPWTIDYEEE